MRLGRWGHRQTVLLTVIAFASLSGECSAADLHLVSVGSFSSPVYITAPSGDFSRVFVVEQPGRIRIVKDGTTLPTPFLDISDLVTNSGEQGLLSIAFAPDYTTTRRYYAYYVNLSGDIQIDEFTASASDPDSGNRTSRRAVITIPHPTNANHNGGQLQFGPDGYLYIGTGDGGGGGDPDENAQNLSSRLGKLLRINPTSSGSNPYQIPADNPFIDGAGPNADEIYAYGLRNPWRFSFDRNTGDLIIADVGQGSWEEMDFRTRGTGLGANFGWDEFEGTHPYEGGMIVGHVPPVFEYGHSGGNCSLTGGYVVRDPLLPELGGRYLYADFCAGALRSLVLSNSSGTDDHATGLTVSNPSTFGEDACARVYVASLGGQVSRIASDGGCLPPATTTNPSPTPSQTASPFVSDSTPGGSTTTAATTTKDTIAPEIRISKIRRERVAKDRKLVVRASCAETCRIRAKGVLRITTSRRSKQQVQKAPRLSSSEQSLRVGQSSSITLKLNKKTIRTVLNALAHHRSVTAVIDIVAEDSSGNKQIERIRFPIAG